LRKNSGADATGELAEWTSVRSYAERVTNLKGTGSGWRANADYFLNVSGPNVTVFDDGR
jgi:fibronectin-binding autotransporter adhesin